MLPGLAEWTVNIVKELAKETDDPYMVRLAYHANPLSWCGISPAEASLLELTIGGREADFSVVLIEF